MKKTYEAPVAAPVRIGGTDILSSSWELPIIPEDEENF